MIKILPTNKRGPNRALALSFCVLLAWLALFGDQSGISASELRRTPIVVAVQKARPSVVNIRGNKVVSASRSIATSAKREVNGMGTGVVIDARGYIITNYHVVDGARRIVVTLHDESKLTANVVSYDAASDLAVIKVDAKKPLTVINIGNSSDLMVAETVVAVGNAFGYHHTVTKGIVSALHRTVRVSDSQEYRDLIQTDASINPGNSGGPLLNIDGEMIGINVAVRAEAQGIGFAIPIDEALSIAARLMSIEKLKRNWHGMVTEASHSDSGAIVKQIAGNSPAQKSTIQLGDVVKSVGGILIKRPLDVERALLAKTAGEEIKIDVLRKNKPLTLSMVVARLPGQKIARSDPKWDILGMRFMKFDSREVRRRNARFRGGLRVTAVRRNSVAQQQGIRAGDILVGIHEWETVSVDNVDYIINRPEFGSIPVKFYILRNNQTLSGEFPIKMTRR